MKAVPYPLRRSILKRMIYFEKIDTYTKANIMKEWKLEGGLSQTWGCQRRGFNNFIQKDKTANEKYDRKIHSKKTKVMKKDLCSWFYQDGNCTRDIWGWLAISMRTPKNLNPLYKHSSKHEKNGVLRACIFLATSYGCVSWATKQCDAQKSS